MAQAFTLKAYTAALRLQIFMYNIGFRKLKLIKRFIAVLALKYGWYSILLYTCIVYCFNILCLYG